MGLNLWDWVVVKLSGTDIAGARTAAVGQDASQPSRAAERAVVLPVPAGAWTTSTAAPDVS
jgi:hypothetical protein